MKNFTCLLLLLVSLFTHGQNGGQFFENNVVKVQFVGNNNITATFWVIGKQNCTADYKVDYGPVEEVTIDAFDTAVFSVPITTVTFKAKAESQTTCTNQPDMGWVEIIVATVLPVKLLSFTGVQSNDLVTLSWKVINETVSKFVIERSTDGRNFTSISTVNKIAGYGSKEYQATDRINSITYYRLKMYDEHGRPEYSKIITFRGKSAYKFKLYGNPFIDKIMFTVNAARPETIKLNIIDMQGRLVLSKSTNVMGGENLVEIPVSIASKGVYQLIVTTHDEIFNNQILKK